MKFPTEFTTGGIKWTIEIQSGCEELENPDETYLGRCNFWKNKVILRELENNVPWMSRTLFHEIIHVVDRHLNIKLKEKQVGKLADGIFEILVDNPDLIPAVLGIDMDQKVCYSKGKGKS